MIQVLWVKAGQLTLNWPFHFMYCTQWKVSGQIMENLGMDGVDQHFWQGRERASQRPVWGKKAISIPWDMRLLLNGTLEHKKKSKLFSNYVNLSAYPFALGEGKSHIDFLSLHIFPFFVSLYAFYIAILFCSFVTEKSREGFLIFLGGNFLPLAHTELKKNKEKKQSNI